LAHGTPVPQNLPLKNFHVETAFDYPSYDHPKVFAVVKAPF